MRYPRHDAGPDRRERGRTVLRRCLTLLAVLVAGAAGGAFAQAYPAKPIRFIVPWAPGGSTDVLARIIAQKMQESWSQPVLVENRPGASGNVGSDIVAKAAPDGYTILVGSMSTHAMNGALYAKMPFRPVEDFAPVAILAYVTNVLVAHPSVKAASVAELVAFARAHPGKLNYASAGSGSTNHLSAALFEKMAGITMTHVPYKGGAPAVVDLVGGQVDVFFTGSTNVLAHVKAGKLKLLAVTEARRAKVLPDLPTVGETLAGYEMAVWYGMFAPAGTPADVVARLNAEANRILQLPDVTARLAPLGAEATAQSAAEFARILRADEQKWSRIIREVGARAE
ncbi:MAG: tripartite tricarboxylate transporter substrate binding protein [Burkholderiales bacterium]|nr:tripartite tricarboxylate transporter substrate binding protein [Burkholderiales bacterium]